jgi:hypothetical protein
MSVRQTFWSQETSQIHKELATVNVVVLLHREIDFRLILQKRIGIG